MDRHDSMLEAFLAGELRAAEARRFDEHLLECEACWRAIRDNRAGRLAAQLLHQPPPPHLSDRIAFAVEVAASARPRARAGQLRSRLAGGGTVVLAALAILLVLLPATRGTPAVPAALQVVTRYAQGIAPSPGPAGGQAGGRQGTPVEIGQPATVTAGGQLIVLRTWRLGGTEAVVAVSQRPFPMPAGATPASVRGMAWSVRLGRLSLYCINGRTSEIVAAPIPAAELPALAAQLPQT
jgi:hypothetical protein